MHAKPIPLAPRRHATTARRLLALALIALALLCGQVAMAQGHAPAPAQPVMMAMAHCHENAAGHPSDHAGGKAVAARDCALVCSVLAPAVAHAPDALRCLDGMVQRARGVSLPSSVEPDLLLPPPRAG